MDPEVSVLLHCTAWGGLLEPQVQVELSARFNRQTEPALESHIEEVWTERVTMEPWLFNGAKFRLHSFSLASPQPSCPSTPQPPYMTGGDRDGRQCSIQKEEEGHNETKGNTDSGRAEVLRHQRGQIDGVIGERQHNDKDLSSYKQREGNLRYAQTSTPGCRDQHPAVGSSAAEAQPFPQRDVGGKGEGPTPILTLRLGLTCYRDFLGTNWSRRARKLRQRAEVEYGDPLALLAQPLGVGGILCTADRQVVLIRRSQQVAEARGLLDIPGGHPEPKAVFEGLDEEDRIRVEMLQWREEAVVRELFSSVCAEIRDEFVFIPLITTPLSVCSCSLTSTEVRELYWQGGIEAQESTDIVFLSQTEVLRLDQSTPLWSELCPSAKGAVLLYQLVMPDQEDKSNRTQTTATAPDKISR
ncbi:uridine diphosphate glucose pyrophosphatase NUDT22 isoform X2 [Salvelinus fontinalis]|uniref:uridine diphosphate glucose pyrophosphatase NUDT22 isoform X2 n=1 Tax=Salvelinus fontinalis TaxID=8038 RepID=UPI002486917F|nr:uridine diphosphate glucose pyrophosphatase NUDT22 isoform X2 [Salvelinus fontinalis]